MKNILYGLMSFGLISVCCWGMENGNNCLMEEDLLNNVTLRELVTMCIDEQEGEAFTRNLLKTKTQIGNLGSDINLARIVAMFKAISADWRRAGYYGVADLNYYISGASSGRFGPFELKDFKDEPQLSTTYSSDIYPDWL